MRRVVVLLAVVALIVGCSTTSGATARPSMTAVELTVYAASSLKGALEDAKATYEAAVPGIG